MQEDHSTRAAEWHYRWIKPCLYIEEFIEGENGNPPPDFKFFCFHGNIGFVTVDKDRFGSFSRTIVDRDFKTAPFSYAYPRHDEEIAPPECLEDMIRVAEALSKNEPFLRVDLYDAGHPVFGELTLYPGSGLDLFDPPEFDEQFGRMI